MGSHCDFVMAEIRSLVVCVLECSQMSNYNAEYLNLETCYLENKNQALEQNLLVEDPGLIADNLLPPTNKSQTKYINK